MKCECGCGQDVLEGNRFIRTHQIRLPSHREAINRAQAARKAQPPADWIKPDGLCQCGCGEATPVAHYTSAKVGIFEGYHLRYLRGHNPTKPVPKRGPDHGNWKGGRIVDSAGYILIWMPSHPQADRHGYIFEHRLNWEAANGRPPTALEHVHHINGVKDDNRPENLIALTRQAHRQLHAQKISAETRHNISNGVRRSWEPDGKRRAQEKH